jgi:hypothetical protein
MSKKCPKCGNEFPEDYNYCGTCAVPLVASSSEQNGNQQIQEQPSVNINANQSTNTTAKKNHKKRNIVLGCVGFIILLMIIGAAFSDGSDDSSTSRDSSTFQSNKAISSDSVSNTQNNNDLTLKSDNKLGYELNATLDDVVARYNEVVERNSTKDCVIGTINSNDFKSDSVPIDKFGVDATLYSYDEFPSNIHYETETQVLTNAEYESIGIAVDNKSGKVLQIIYQMDTNYYDSNSTAHYRFAAMSYQLVHMTNPHLSTQDIGNLLNSMDKNNNRYFKDNIFYGSLQISYNNSTYNTLKFLACSKNVFDGTAN